MATDVKIDPATRSFVELPDGSWEETDDASTAVLCQLDSRVGQWWGDASAGSRNAEILESDLPTSEALQDSTRSSLRRLVAAGLLSDAFVTSLEEDNAGGFTALLVRWFDRSSSRPVDLAYSPLGGAP